MSVWKDATFVDLLCEPVRNGIYKEKAFHGRGAKIVNMGELFAHPRLTDVDMKRVEITEKEKSKCLLKEGDLIFARRSLTAEGAGKCSVVKEVAEDVTFESSIIRARPNREKADPYFLYYYFNSPYGKYLLGTILRQVAVAGITGSDLMGLTLNVPDVKEQKDIASVLSSLDDKIDLLHRQNKTLESMSETLFRQWFVEEAREDWAEGKIEDLFVLQRGFDLPAQNRNEGSYPIFAASGFSGRHNEYKVKAPGVTTGRSGLLGKVFFIMEDFWPLNTSLFIKEYKTATPLFSYFLLKTIDLESFNAGSAVPTLNRNHVHEYSIGIPPRDLIERFELLVMPNFEKIKSNEFQIHTLEKFRDTLLPKLMSGEVRVKP